MDLTSGVRIVPDMQGDQRDMVTLFNNISDNKTRQQQQARVAEAAKLKPLQDIIKGIDLKGLEERELNEIMPKIDEVSSDLTKMFMSPGDMPEWKLNLEAQKRISEITNLVEQARTFRENYVELNSETLLDDKYDNDVNYPALQKITTYPTISERFTGLNNFRPAVKVKPFSMSEVYKNDIFQVQEQDYDGTVKFLPSQQEEHIRYKLKNDPQTQELLKQSGLSEDDFVKSAVQEAKARSKNKVSIDGRSDGGGSSSSSSEKKVTQNNIGDFKSSDTKGNYTLKNGFDIQTKTEGDFVQISAKQLRTTGDDPTISTSGNVKVLVNESKIGWVETSRADKRITVNGKHYMPGDKIGDEDIEAFRKAGGKTGWHRVISTVTSGGAEPVEIFVSDLTSAERKRWGLKDNEPAQLNDADYRRIYLKEQKVKKVNKYGI